MSSQNHKASAANFATAPTLGRTLSQAVNFAHRLTAQKYRKAVHSSARCCMSRRGRTGTQSRRWCLSPRRAIRRHITLASGQLSVPDVCVQPSAGDAARAGASVQRRRAGTGCQALEVLGTAQKHLNSSTTQVCVVCSHLLGPLRELERLYRDAEQALVGKPLQGQLQAEVGSAAAARAALFDDDLDLRGPDRSNAGRQVLRFL